MAQEYVRGELIIILTVIFVTVTYILLLIEILCI